MFIDFIRLKIDFQDWLGNGTFTENKLSVTIIKKSPYSSIKKYHHHNYRNNILGHISLLNYLANITKIVSP